MVKKVFSGFAIASAILYIFFLFNVLFINFGRGNNTTLSEHMRLTYTFNLTPFKTIAEYCTNLMEGRNRGSAIMNLAGNLLLLLPLGFYLPFLAKKTAKIQVYAVIVTAVTIIIEVSQMMTRTGSLDIDDFILNLTGALIGITICKQISIHSLLKLHAY